MRARIIQLLELSQGSSFLKFVLEAAKLHFAEENFEKLKVPQRFGPTFFTTMLVSGGQAKKKLGKKTRLKRTQPYLGASRESESELCLRSILETHG